MSTLTVTSPFVFPSFSPAAFKFPRLVRRSGKKRKGYTIVELMVSAAVIAIAIIGVYVFVTGVITNNKVTNETNYYATMSSDTRTVYATATDFTGISPAKMIELGLVPSTLVKAGAIVSTFNTPITVAPTNLHGTAGDGVEFTYTLPRDACTKFVQKAAMLSARVLVDSAPVLDRTTGLNVVDVTVLGSQCKSADGGNVTIALAVGR